MFLHRPGVIALAAARAAEMRSKRGDELTVLPDIGATVQEFLYGLGINRIDQLSKLTDDEVARIQRAIDESQGSIIDSPQRIIRWKEAAQAYLARMKPE